MDKSVNGNSGDPSSKQVGPEGKKQNATDVEIDQQILQDFKYSIQKILHEEEEFNAKSEQVKELGNYAKLLGITDLNDLDIEIDDEEKFQKLNDAFKKSQRVRKFKPIHALYITGAVILLLSILIGAPQLYKNKKLRDNIKGKLMKLPVIRSIIPKKDI